MTSKDAAGLSPTAAAGGGGENDKESILLPLRKAVQEQVGKDHQLRSYWSQFAIQWHVS